jgi:hypothetical protein
MTGMRIYLQNRKELEWDLGEGREQHLGASNFFIIARSLLPSSSTCTFFNSPPHMTTTYSNDRSIHKTSHGGDIQKLGKCVQSTKTWMSKLTPEKSTEALKMHTRDLYQHLAASETATTTNKAVKFLQGEAAGKIAEFANKMP